VSRAPRRKTAPSVVLPTTHSILDAVAVMAEVARHFDLGAGVHGELVTRGMNDV